MTSDASLTSEMNDSHHDSDALETASLMSPRIVLPLPSKPPHPEPIRLGIMASGSGSNFECISQAIGIGALNAQIQVMVYNNPTAKAADRADRLEIPKVLINHRNFPSREALDEAIVEVMRDQQVEWIVMAGWMRVVTEVLIQAFPKRILNIHPSLLPSFPGVRAVEQALAAGVKLTGCTVHYVELEVDSGPIIIQAAVPVLPTDTVETLHARIQAQEHLIYPRGIALAALASTEQRS
jgi:phosphoribosylglycinamide formyltransferase-1